MTGCAGSICPTVSTRNFSLSTGERPNTTTTSDIPTCCEVTSWLPDPASSGPTTSIRRARSSTTISPFSTHPLRTRRDVGRRRKHRRKGRDHHHSRLHRDLGFQYPEDPQPASSLSADGIARALRDTPVG